MAGKKNQDGPKTAFGRYMVYTFIPKYANNVQGLVYMGAAFLIIIVGLRGLGTVAYDIPIVPKFLFDSVTHKVAPMWVMAALFLEFSLLMVLAIVTFFTPEEFGGGEPEKAASGDNELARLKSTINEIKGLAQEDINFLNRYVDEVGNVTKRLAGVKTEFFKSMDDLKRVFKG